MRWKRALLSSLSFAPVILNSETRLMLDTTKAPFRPLDARANIFAD
jgi:hypothetical protein